MTRMIRSLSRYLGSRTAQAGPMDDAAALARFATVGDPRAFEFLVYRYQSMVIHTCRRVMASQADAEDAAQETFLMLARKAGEVRSNVAAWLHACALCTSIDLARARATRRDAEARAAGSMPQQDDDRSWNEIKPLLDEAIAALHESDRELIVARFLAGRSQIDLAREAHIHPGTMHRRIDAALERLRVELSKRGVTSTAVVGGAGVVGVVGVVGGVSVGGAGSESLAALLARASADSVAQSTTSNLVSIGLAEMGKASGAGSATLAGYGISTLVAATVAGVLGLGAVGGYWFASSSAPALAGVAVAAPASTTSGGFDRPTKESARFPLIAMISADQSGGTMTHAGDEIRLAFPSKKSGGRQIEIVLRVKDVNLGSQPIAAKVLIESTSLPAENPFHKIVGSTTDARIRIDGDHVRFELTTNWTPTDEDKKADRSLPPVIVWTGGRADPAPNAVRNRTASIPDFGGKWNWVEEWSLHFDPDNIFLTTRHDDGHEYNAFRFRIIDWENVGSHCRVQAIVSESTKENSMVGKRVKMLIRRNPESYAIVLKEPHSKEINEWPAGFNVKAGEGQLLLQFRRNEP